MARVQGPAALRIIGKVFTALGLVALAIAGALYAWRHSSLEGRVHADGKVIALRWYSRGYHPVVEFTLPDGGVVHLESAIGSNPPRFHEGEALAVLYPPAAPQEALIDEFWSLWFVAVLPAILGGVFGLVGLGLLLGSRIGREKTGAAV